MIEYSCITFQGSFYILSSLKEKYLQGLPQGHPDIIKMKLRAHSSIYYWIAVNNEIVTQVMKYELCQTTSRSMQKKLTIPMQVLNRPWQKLAVFLLFQSGKWYLLTAD